MFGLISGYYLRIQKHYNNDTKPILWEMNLNSLSHKDTHVCTMCKDTTTMKWNQKTANETFVRWRIAKRIILTIYLYLHYSPRFYQLLYKYFQIMFKWNFYSLNFGDIYMFSSQFYLLSESITLPKTESKAMKVHTNKSSNNSLDILVKWNSLPFYYYILNIWSHPPFSSIITYYCISNVYTKSARSLEWIYSIDITWTAISATTTQMNLTL